MVYIPFTGLSLVLALVSVVGGSDITVFSSQSPAHSVLESHQSLFDNFNFNADNGLDEHEFSSLFLSLFSDEEKRYILPKSVEKIFHCLNTESQDKIHMYVSRKIFNWWLLPLISPRSCLLYCVDFELPQPKTLEESKATIELALELFNVHYVYLAQCSFSDSTVFAQNLIRQLKQSIKNVVIKEYHPEEYTNMTLAREYDQMVLDLNNVLPYKHTLSQLFRSNVRNQFPMVFFGPRESSSSNMLSRYFDNRVVHDSILVSENFKTNVRDRVRYKTELAVKLALKYYRKYKQFTPMYDDFQR